MPRYKVKQGTQVNVDGKIYAEGETLELEDTHQARVWLNAGYIEETKTPKKASRKR